MSDNDSRNALPGSGGGRTPGRRFTAYEVGQVVQAVSARLDAKKTQPPERYSQDTLLDAMVNAYRFGRSDAEREMLKEVGGLGTSRTRVPMIEGMVRRELLATAKKGKAWQIWTTPLARQILPNVPDDMKTVAMTARQEVALAGVASGKFDSKDVIDRGYKFTTRIVGLIKDSKALSNAAAAASAAGSATGSAVSPGAAGARKPAGTTPGGYGAYGGRGGAAGAGTGAAGATGRR